MSQKRVTFFIVSHQTGETKKIIIPTVWLKAAIFLISVVALVFVAGLMDYFGLMVQTIENKKLHTENAQMLKQFQIVEGKVSSLENSLERVKSFTTKLKLITNVDAEDRVSQLTMGQKVAPGQGIDDFEPMEQRPPPEVLAGQDSEFAPPQQPNIKTGELAQEKASTDYSSLVVRIDRAVRETQLKEQSVIELWESLSERQSLLNATPNVKPARGWITSRFGYRLNPFNGKQAMHAGIDIAASPGSPVYSPADGVVTFASYDESYGKLVSIDHGYGVSTRFGHNSQVYVHVGQKVSKWDVIAAVGNTGRSTGPHLHYEVRISGTPVNPMNFVLDE